MQRYAVMSGSLALSLALFAADSFAQQDSNGFRGAELLYSMPPPVAARAGSSDSYGDMLSAAISARSAAIAAAQSPGAADSSRTVSGSLLDARVGASSPNFLSATIGATVGQYTGQHGSTTHSGSLVDARAGATSPSLVNATTGATVGQHTGPHSTDPYGDMLGAAIARTTAATSYASGPSAAGPGGPGASGPGAAGPGSDPSLSGSAAASDSAASDSAGSATVSASASGSAAPAAPAAPAVPATIRGEPAGARTANEKPLACEGFFRCAQAAAPHTRASTASIRSAASAAAAAS